VNEVSAFAMQRAVDYIPEKGSAQLVLFLDLGSRKSEVSVVQVESMAPVVTLLGSAIYRTIGGHLMDLEIAEVLPEKFQEKHPKLARGVLESPRALRRLLLQSQKTKAILGSNKVAPFIVESLFVHTDFQITIEREESEAMCKDVINPRWVRSLSSPRPRTTSTTSRWNISSKLRPPSWTASATSTMTPAWQGSWASRASYRRWTAARSPNACRRPAAAR